jgi:glutaminase
MMVIPNFGAIALWSPRCEEGNSVRGVEFAKVLLSEVNV